jgi:hypothetical protein
VDSEVVESRNRDVWGFKECIPSEERLRQENDPTVIEVDPAYLYDDD